MNKVIRVGLLGCGVVGGGVIEALYQNHTHIGNRDGIQIDIVKIAVRDVERPRTAHVPAHLLCDDWRDVCESHQIDVVVEVMGGIEPARTAILTALKSGKHVVTANKAVLAQHGAELIATAKANGRTLLFEASALGGIPAIHLLDSYFSANRMLKISGILNGTCNYLLHQMASAGMSCAEALSAAQDAGYAEADPTQDIEAHDSLFKLEILSWLALGVNFPLEDVLRIGITNVDHQVIQLLNKLGCQMKLVGQIERVASTTTANTKIEREGNPAGYRASVAPVVVPNDHPLFGVQGVQNALCVEADIVGQVMLVGPGAGALPTASAVVEDLVKIAKGIEQVLTWDDILVEPTLHEAFLVTHTRGCAQRALIDEPSLTKLLSQEAYNIYHLYLEDADIDGVIVHLSDQPMTQREFEDSLNDDASLTGELSVYPFHAWSPAIVTRCAGLPRKTYVGTGHQQPLQPSSLTT